MNEQYLKRDIGLPNKFRTQRTESSKNVNFVLWNEQEKIGIHQIFPNKSGQNFFLRC